MKTQRWGNQSQGEVGPFEQMVPGASLPGGLPLKSVPGLSLWAEGTLDFPASPLHTRERPRSQREARTHQPYLRQPSRGLLSGASYLQTWRSEVLGAGQPVGSPFLPIPCPLLRPSSRSDCQGGGLHVQVLVLPGSVSFCSVRPACPGQHGAHSAPSPRSLSLFCLI